MPCMFSVFFCNSVRMLTHMSVWSIIKILKSAQTSRLAIICKLWFFNYVFHTKTRLFFMQSSQNKTCIKFQNESNNFFLTWVWIFTWNKVIKFFATMYFVKKQTWVFEFSLLKQGVLVAFHHKRVWCWAIKSWQWKVIRISYEDHFYQKINCYQKTNCYQNVNKCMAVSNVQITSFSS